MVEGNKAVVHVAVVDKVDLSVIRQRVVKLMPRMLNQCDGDIAQRGGELGQSQLLEPAGST